MEKITHKTLPCGIELGCVEIPQRRVVAIQFRVLSGTAHEPDDHLGLARLIQETIDLGTEKRDGRALSDAFDEIGASHGGWVGREASAYHSVVMPEFLDRAVELHAEYLRTPTFPNDKVEIAVDLTRQEWNALQDDAHGLADKLIGAQAYGKYLGRHTLSEPEFLDRIERQNLIDHWTGTYSAGRMQVTAGGALDTDGLIDLLEKYFAGFGSNQPDGRSHFDVNFLPRHIHHHKDLEQQQIGIAFPGTAATTSDYPVQRVMLGVLSGGMSSRLFTEVREKLGLVYWVSAWGEKPRGSGMIFLGASTKPQRCQETFAALLREVDRLNKDLTDTELDRVSRGIVARLQTQGDTTGARCNELAEDLFQFGHPVDRRVKIDRIKAVTVDNIHKYLSDHPRSPLSVVTLGPRIMDGAQAASDDTNGGSIR